MSLFVIVIFLTVVKIKNTEQILDLPESIDLCNNSIFYIYDIDPKLFSSKLGLDHYTILEQDIYFDKNEAVRISQHYSAQTTSIITTGKNKHTIELNNTDITAEGKRIQHELNKQFQHQNIYFASDYSASFFASISMTVNKNNYVHASFTPLIYQCTIKNNNNGEKILLKFFIIYNKSIQGFINATYSNITSQ